MKRAFNSWGFASGRTKILQFSLISQLPRVPSGLWKNKYFRMKKIAFIAAIASLSLFASCEKDISINVPPYQSKLTVFSASNIGEPIVVSVGKSLSIADRKNNPDL